MLWSVPGRTGLSVFARKRLRRNQLHRSAWKNWYDPPAVALPGSSHPTRLDRGHEHEPRAQSRPRLALRCRFYRRRVGLYRPGIAGFLSPEIDRNPIRLEPVELASLSLRSAVP